MAKQPKTRPARKVPAKAKPDLIAQNLKQIEEIVGQIERYSKLTDEYWSMVVKARQTHGNDSVQAKQLLRRYEDWDLHTQYWLYRLREVRARSVEAAFLKLDLPDRRQELLASMSRGFVSALDELRLLCGVKYPM